MNEKRKKSNRGSMKCQIKRTREEKEKGWKEKRRKQKGRERSRKTRQSREGNMAEDEK